MEPQNWKVNLKITVQVSAYINCQLSIDSVCFMMCVQGVSSLCSVTPYIEHNDIYIYIVLLLTLLYTLL